MHRRILTVVAGLIFAPVLAIAAEPETTSTNITAPPTVTLTPVEVTAEQQRSPLEGPPPALKTKVTAAEIEMMNAPTISEAIKYQPGLTVRHLFPGDNNAEVAMRGANRNQTGRLLVKTDALLLSNYLKATWRAAPRWGMVQPEEVESIEIIYGPYSAEYSGHSMAGVVIIHTGMPDDFQAQVGVSGFAQTFDLYGTDETYWGHKLHASIGDKIGRWSYTKTGEPPALPGRQ